MWPWLTNTWRGLNSHKKILSAVYFGRPWHVTLINQHLKRSQQPQEDLVSSLLDLGMWPWLTNTWRGLNSHKKISSAVLGMWPWLTNTWRGLNSHKKILSAVLGMWPWLTNTWRGLTSHKKISSTVYFGRPWHVTLINQYLKRSQQSQEALIGSVLW